MVLLPLLQFPTIDKEWCRLQSRQSEKMEKGKCLWVGTAIYWRRLTNSLQRMRSNAKVLVFTASQSYGLHLTPIICYFGIEFFCFLSLPSCSYFPYCWIQIAKDGFLLLIDIEDKGGSALMELFDRWIVSLCVFRFWFQIHIEEYSHSITIWGSPPEYVF